jgi:predicted phosphoribosyltransferase
MRTFRDRADAGRQLADQLGAYAADGPIVLALPRGGVVPAFEIARTLHAPLDVLVVRKLGALGQPEFGIGAIAPDEVRVVDWSSARLAGMDESDVRAVVEREKRELARREERYRAGRPPLEVRGKTVILVDDGVATGVSVRAAIAYLRKRGVGRIVLAVGVMPPQTAEVLRSEVDDLVCVLMPDDLMAVGLYFDDFAPVEDDEVIALLDQASRAPVAR